MSERQITRGEFHYRDGRVLEHPVDAGAPMIDDRWQPGQVPGSAPRGPMFFLTSVRPDGVGVYAERGAPETS